MVERTSRSSKVAAAVLVATNLIVMVLAGFLFAGGLWVIASPTTLRIAVESTGSATIMALLVPEVLTVRLGVGLAAVATFAFFVAVMGFCGAVTRSQFLLFMYSTLVLLLLLLECALLYYFSSSLVEKGLQEGDGQWTHALRLAFSCCDHNASTPETLKPPWSCCGPKAHPDNCTTGNTFGKKCHEAITTWLDTYQTAIYATLAVTHIILSSCSLVRRRS